MASMLVDSFADDFRPEDYTDEYREELQQLIDAKLEGGEAFPTPEKEERRRGRRGGRPAGRAAAQRRAAEEDRLTPPDQIEVDHAVGRCSERSEQHLLHDQQRRLFQGALGRVLHDVRAAARGGRTRPAAGRRRCRCRAAGRTPIQHEVEVAVGPQRVPARAATRASTIAQAGTSSRVRWSSRSPHSPNRAARQVAPRSTSIRIGSTGCPCGQSAAAVSTSARASAAISAESRDVRAHVRHPDLQRRVRRRQPGVEVDHPVVHRGAGREQVADRPVVALDAAERLGRSGGRPLPPGDRPVAGVPGVLALPVRRVRRDRRSAAAATPRIRSSDRDTLLGEIDRHVDVLPAGQLLRGR